jgi:hypothetical protein
MPRIRRALVALVVILAVAGVAGLGTLGVLRAREDARARADAAIRDRVRVAARVVHDAITDDLNAVAATITRPLFRSAVISKRYSGTHAYLSELIATHPHLVAVTVFDRTGILVARIPFDPAIGGKRFSQQEYFVKAKNNAFHISGLITQLGKPKVPVIPYSVRIFFGGGVVGVLSATTPITAFDSLVSPFTPAGATIRVYNQIGERVSPSTEASGKTYTGDTIVGPALKGGSDVRRTAGSVVASAPIADYGWAVVVSQPIRRADAGLSKLTERYVLLAGGAFLLALIAAALAWSRRAAAGS